mmetsp:Transcript_76274/g.192013  ORF Transcript_76274/g.192013 Transcript_76274/m.192013 type:complete len:363 (-) Transcript_76274:420-1508(-)
MSLLPVYVLLLSAFALEAFPDTGVVLQNPFLIVQRTSDIESMMLCAGDAISVPAAMKHDAVFLECEAGRCDWPTNDRCVWLQHEVGGMIKSKSLSQECLAIDVQWSLHSAQNDSGEWVVPYSAGLSPGSFPDRYCGAVSGLLSCPGAPADEFRWRSGEASDGRRILANGLSSFWDKTPYSCFSGSIGATPLPQCLGKVRGSNVINTWWCDDPAFQDDGATTDTGLTRMEISCLIESEDSCENSCKKSGFYFKSLGGPTDRSQFCPTCACGSAIWTWRDWLKVIGVPLSVLAPLCTIGFTALRCWRMRYPGQQDGEDVEAQQQHQQLQQQQQQQQRQSRQDLQQPLQQQQTKRRHPRHLAVMM